MPHPLLDITSDVPPKSSFFLSSPVYQLHVFGDASKRAYGALAFLVKDNAVSFIMSKSKINPKKDELS